MEVRVGRCDLGSLASSGQEQHPHRGWPVESCCILLEGRLEQRHDWPPLLVETRQGYKFRGADGVPGAHAAIAQIHTHDPIGSECARRGRLIGRGGLDWDSISCGPATATTHKGEHVWTRADDLALPCPLPRPVASHPPGCAPFIA